MKQHDDYANTTDENNKALPNLNTYQKLQIKTKILIGENPLISISILRDMTDREGFRITFIQFCFMAFLHFF